MSGTKTSGRREAAYDDDGTRTRRFRAWLGATLGLLMSCGGGAEDPAAGAEAAPEDSTPAPAADEAGEVADGAAADGSTPRGDGAAAADDDGASEAEPTPSVMPPPPDPATLTMHGLAAYEVVTIYAEPNLESTKLGYLRMGHRTMVTPKVDDQGEGCRKGWHALPAGGYVCASKGMTVEADKEPYMHQPPPRPRLDDPMPYDYGVVARNGTEMWWRPPDALERELAAEKFAAIEAKAAAEAAAAAGEPPPTPTPKPKPKAAPTGDGPAAGDGGAATPTEALPGLDDLPATPSAPPTEEELAEQRRKEAEAAKRAEEERLRQQEKEAEEAKLRQEKMAKLPLHPETPFLEKGFMVTTALKIKDKGRQWWRTSRGGYLDTGKVYRRGEPKIVQVGVELGERTFPFAFTDDDAKVFERNEEGKLQRVGSLDYRTFVDGTEVVEIDGREYMHTVDDQYIRVSDLRITTLQAPPQDLGGNDHWIDVVLGEQLLVAYEGERPVFTTLVSTGRKGTEEEPFDTPTGTFRIVTKHVSSSMDGNTASDGAYSIQDVPWAMFFHGNYALHGAFWHGGFGGRRSHGCINLAVADARWLFWWVGPQLPEGWHGAAANADSPGSVVVVRD